MQFLLDLEPEEEVTIIINTILVGDVMLNMYYCVQFCLNRKIDKKMKSRNSNLLNVIQFYLFYVSIVLIVTPLGVYLISFLSENYLFVNDNAKLYQIIIRKGPV